MPQIERKLNVRIDSNTVRVQHLSFPEKMGVDGREPAESVDLVVAYERKRFLRKRRQMLQVEIANPGEKATAYVPSQELIAEGFERGRGIAIDPEKAIQGETVVLEGSVGYWVEFVQYDTKEEFVRRLRHR
ncbi:MAG: hypothetical protein A2629_02040 [Candidatus Levybacteria bacterium RIFCSPHIGHO2_01_FULL_41_15]|nr:MAG: hypothetical protein A2629_02040 [Candidatus Levybacteria bacterium RIFCSPHIGHO2_01_FULL_41_15]